MESLLFHLEIDDLWDIHGILNFLQYPAVSKLQNWGNIPQDPDEVRVRAALANLNNTTLTNPPIAQTARAQMANIEKQEGKQNK
jgi:hypothetical protein